MVTVAALVVVEVVSLGILIILLNSDYLINVISVGLRDSLVTQARPFLETEPTDLEGLNTWLLLLTDEYSIDGQPVPQITRGLTINIDDEGSSIFILDPDYMLLAQSPPPEDPVALGRPFDPTILPELPELLSLARTGEADINRLYTTLPDGTLILSVPITNQNNTVLGIGVVTLPLPAFDMATLSPILSLVLVSLIPITLSAGLIGTIFGFLTARGLSRRLGHLATAADSWSQGDFSVVTADLSQDELGQLSRRLNRMAEQLQNLLQTRQELATLEERNRLARDLHDSVKQQVFATTMQLSAAKALLDTNPEKARGHLQEAEQLSRQSQQELAGLIEELRPAALESKGLVEALREFAGNWSRRTQINAQVRTQGERPIPLPIEQALFRVAQEALANVARHSQAQTADIHLAWDNDHIIMTISDNGRGFDVEKGEQTGFGKQTMQERVTAVNGTLSVNSTPGKGTQIIARVNSLPQPGEGHE